MSALYSGATGMKTHDAGLSSVSNNIANVSTIGYKSQYALFQDLMSQTLSQGTTGGQTFNQLGTGAQMAANRTVNTVGAFEPGSEATDLAITGKGYFQVTDGDEQFYTRAGNFRFNHEGWLRTPEGMNVTGMAMTNGKITGDAAPIRIDPNDTTIAKSPPKATANLTGIFNLPKNAVDNSTARADEEEANPFFSLLNKWNGAVTSGNTVEQAGRDIASPLPTGSFSEKQTLKVIDASGQTRELQVYFDGVSAESSGVGGTTYEYIVAADAADVVGQQGTPDKNTGALMAGTITFSPSGDIVDMTAFVPAGTDNPENPLTRWTPATMVDGKPQFSASFDGAGAQTITLDMGISAGSNAWANAPASAADVGTDRTLLGGMNDVTRGERASKTSNDTVGSSTAYTTQDGWIEGDYTNMEVTADGIVRMHYSNAQTSDLFTIPLYRFTSEDGLRREGGNLYMATPESGETQWGVPGTSNYGALQSKQLESSNVEMSREMVSLITMQRGFQMNSKSITTADQLLQKAMEIKRN